MNNYTCPKCKSDEAYGRMGNIRTPKVIYKNKHVMTFYVNNKEIYYTIYKWADDGLSRFAIATGKLGTQNPQDILNSTLQTFTSVEVEN